LLRAEAKPRERGGERATVAEDRGEVGVGRGGRQGLGNGR
jgi:hypothetical protein